MDQITVKKINQLNQNFYQQAAEYFSDTRNYSWQGWQQILELIKKIPAASQPINILDLGCGNGRFGQFLSQHIDRFNYWGLDSSQKLLNIAQKKNLATASQQFHFQHFDLIEESPSKLKQKFDLIAVFGVIHHIPSFDLRKKLLTELENLLQPGGKIIISAWQFAAESRFDKKIINSKIVGINKTDLEKNDFILDWKRGPTQYRYAHMLDEAETRQLIAATQLKLATSFYADGKSGKLNLYLILSK